MSTIFSGNSRFATDFRAVIDRSVAIASLPLQQLRSVKDRINAEISALGGIETKFGSLQSAVDGLKAAAGQNSYSLSVSNGAVVKGRVAGTARPGSYSVEVTGMGTYSNAISNSSALAVADPATEGISTSTSFTLVVNGVSHSVAVPGATLEGLVDAINELEGANVQATLVNVGSTASPNYRLAVQSTRLAPDAIQLSDGSVDLLDTLSTGSPATYKVNGLPTEIESDSRTITLAPGVTADLLQVNATPVTISVTRSSSSIKTALGTFVSAYNAVLDELDKQRGQDAGALAGQSIVYSLGRALSALSTYSSDDGVSMTSLGLEFSRQGRITFDSNAFDELSPQSVLQFLGDDDTGFLQTANAALGSVTDSSSGVLHNALSTAREALDGQDDSIAEYEERIDALRESLEAQMAASDALIAGLEQQAEYLNNLFISIRGNQENSK